MKLVIVQLSDIHIKTADDLILQKAHKIVSAIKSVEPTATAFLLAVTGDIAYSGIKEQHCCPVKDRTKSVGWGH